MAKQVIYHRVAIAIDDLVDSLEEDLGHDDLIAFIKSLDEKVADWDFTLGLHRYFLGQKDIFDEEGDI